jgi:2-oxoacid:acceptor oxidoreductase delta subunit (pyruvate/2-ketoisovalerate family)
VTVREAAGQCGGRLRGVFPESLLPGAIVDAEIERVLGFGIDVELETPVDELPVVGEGCEFVAVIGAPARQEGHGAETSVSGEDELMTSQAGVFSGGVASTSDRSVVPDFGRGKRLALAIDAWLTGAGAEVPTRSHPSLFEQLNTWYFDDSPRSAAVDSSPALAAAEALSEARRCLSCGGCFECDTCYSVCPDNAVIKLGAGRGYQFDLDYCKGCGICVTECPSGAIAMEKETL